jgi:hypothetical protein
MALRLLALAIPILVVINAKTPAPFRAELQSG